jgi:hypothetical protein
MVMQLMPPMNQQQQSRLIPMRDFMRDVRRDTPTSNLEALRYLQQLKETPITYQDINPQVMEYMNTGGLMSLPVERRIFGGIAKGIRNIGKGVASGLRGIGKGISGALSGSSGDMLKTIALTVLANALLPGSSAIMQGAWGPYIQAAKAYAIPSLASGGLNELTSDPLREDKLMRAAAAWGMAKYGPDMPVSDPDKTNTMSVGEGTPTDLNTAPSGTDPAWVTATKQAVTTPVPYTGGQTPLSLAGTTASSYLTTQAADEAREMQLAEDTAKEAAQKLADRYKQGEIDRATFARLAVEDPVLYNYTYKFADDPQSIEEILEKLQFGSPDIQTAQQFDPATYTTASGREPGSIEIPSAAAYGGGLQTINRKGGGQGLSFFEGRVPNTVDPNSDGMSDSETMLITNPQGTKPTGILKISEDEYVISAPDMAILGNGSPQAGAKVMDSFRKDLRTAAYGTGQHQPPLNQNKALQSLTHKAFG